MAGNPAVTHQAFQALPPADMPFLDERGNVSVPWYLFLNNIWQRLGGSQANTPGATHVNTGQAGTDASPYLYQSNNNTRLGQVPTDPLLPNMISAQS